MLLKTENLNKYYSTGKIKFHALKDINLEIREGEFTALVGPSGSGKTTLLNCLGCIDKGDSGKIFLEGTEIGNKSSDESALLRRNSFGFIFQTYNLIPVLTVYENIELPLRLLKTISEKDMYERVMSLLERVGLGGLDARRPMELSGGQQQRVSVARALVKNPKIIFADEPTANLDSSTGESTVDLMKELNVNEKMTFVFSTHDDLIMKHAKRLIHIRDGKTEEA